MVRDADALLRRLFPICRSLTGNGVRETLRVLDETVPFDQTEIPSGTVCYDWMVPNEWNIADAFVADATGCRLIDFRENNLHVVSYSVPVDRVMSFAELRPHLHSLPAMPTAIPYRTSYYREEWGFCLTHEQLATLDASASYHVRIDARLEPGSMTTGERVVGGASGREYLLSAYCCHPSMANDSLSGVVLWTLLLRELASRPLRHRYRFVVLPETIGAIAYLHQHEAAMQALAGGYVITTVAGPGSLGYKESFLGNHVVDRAVRLAFRDLGREHIAYPFDVIGSDESHYSAPFFRIPVGTICKDKYYEYPFYHTSLDNLEFVSAEHLVTTLEVYLAAIGNLENDLVCRSLNPWCEPMLGKHGLYPQLGGQFRQPARAGDGHSAYQIEEGISVSDQDVATMLWIMFLSDGRASLLDVAERTGTPVASVRRLAESLASAGLLELPPDAAPAPSLR